MMKRFEFIFTVLQVPFDFCALLIAAIAAYMFRFSPIVLAWKPVAFDLSLTEYLYISFFVALGWIVLFALLGLYVPNQNRKFFPDVVRIIIGCSSGLSAISLYILFTQQLFDSRFLVLFSFLFAIAFLVLARLCSRIVKYLLYRARVGLRRVVIIGKGDLSTMIVQLLEQHSSYGYHIVGQYTGWGAKQKKEILTQSIDELIVLDTSLTRDDMVRLISFCHEHHIVFKYAADLFSAYASHSRIHPLEGVPIVELIRTPLEGWGSVVKRLFDVVLSLFFLIVLIPVFLLVACIIFCETGRPVFYKNERIGERGRKFFVYKFRSMYVKDCTGPQFGARGKQAEKKEQELIKKQNTRHGPIYKVADDPRVTPFGKLIRRLSLDELPQFLNVFTGTMSIVGPRPHQPREVEGYIEEHKKVFAIKPGVTGLAQISGRSDLSYEEEVRLDVFYIEHWTLFLDIIIFLKTPFVLFKRRKAL